MSLRPHHRATEAASTEASCELDPCMQLLPCLAALRLSDRGQSTDGTGKRRLDGEYANSRLKSPISDGWANERFRQCMVLVREFANEWPDASPLLTSDDVQYIRIQLDVALSSGIRAGHIADDYDSNPTTWIILIVQQTKATRTGGWKTESERVQHMWSFEYLYEFLVAIAAPGYHRNLYDPDGRRIARYRVPVKVMIIPPKKEQMFRFRKSARRLSEWLEAGGLPPLAEGIVNMVAPNLVAPLPLAVERAKRRQAMWSRVANKAQRRPLWSARSSSADDTLTREVVNSVVQESSGVMTDAEADAMEAELEAEMEAAAFASEEAVAPAPAAGGESSDADLDGILSVLTD